MHHLSFLFIFSVVNYLLIVVLSAFGCAYVQYIFQSLMVGCLSAVFSLICGLLFSMFVFEFTYFLLTCIELLSIHILRRIASVVGLVVKASASKNVRFRAQFPFVPWGFFWVESYLSVKNWHYSGYPARRLVL